MIDHVSLAVSDLARSGRFYDAVLGEIALQRLVTRSRSIGYGKRYPELWLNLREPLPSPTKDPGAHVAVRAASPAAVERFHSVAIASGGLDDGLPGWRQGEVARYFAAFVRDPDGNRLEAVTFQRSGA